MRNKHTLAAYYYHFICRLLLVQCLSLSHPKILNQYNRLNGNVRIQMASSHDIKRSNTFCISLHPTFITLAVLNKCTVLYTLQRKICVVGRVDIIICITCFTSSK